MALQQAMRDIRAKIDKFGGDLDNEEITKDVLIRPMIQALGYDSSDPTQVKAEYSVSLRTGGRGRADYVILNNGRPAIVMECKALGVPLDRKIQDQMLQYARALGAFAGIVTDGDTYLCFANAEDENRVDSRPYHELLLSDPADRDEEALGMLHRNSFFQKQLKAKAETFVVAIDQRTRLAQFLDDPATSEEFYRIAAIEDDTQRKSELEQTLELLQEVIHDAVEKMASGEAQIPEVITTNEEYDAFLLCKGMVHGVVEPHRVEFRDSKTYASVLIDDNNRKPLCRFHFNGRIKHIGTFDAGKQETRHAIEDLDDILKLAAKLRRTARQYV